MSSLPAPVRHSYHRCHNQKFLEKYRLRYPVADEDGQFGPTIIAPAPPSAFSRNPCGKICERRWIQQWHTHQNYLWNPHARWGDSPGRLICPWQKPWKRFSNICPRSWTAKKFARHAGIDRNVQTVSSISKPEFTMKMNEGLLAWYFIKKEALNEKLSYFWNVNHCIIFRFYF